MNSTELQSFKPGETVNAQVLYYIPITGPVNFTIEKDGASYAFASEYPKLPIATKPDTGNPGNGDPGTGTCNGVDVTTINTYPNWPRTDWAGNPSHANAGDYIIHNQVVFQANWWTSKEPVEGGDWKKVCAL
jgi:chitinase